jgi:hypothetical protein
MTKETIMKMILNATMKLGWILMPAEESSKKRRRPAVLAGIGASRLLLLDIALLLST